MLVKIYAEILHHRLIRTIYEHFKSVFYVAFLDFLQELTKTLHEES